MVHEGKDKLIVLDYSSFVVVPVDKGKRLFRDNLNLGHGTLEPDSLQYFEVLEESQTGGVDREHSLVGL
jgi:hypothetical protein